MGKNAILTELESEQFKTDIPEFHAGDTIRISLRIIEGTKERTQAFEGTVIARRGSGLSETVALHRIAYAEGMERVFLLHSPRISKIEVTRQGKVRRAKLYHLRGSSGKRSKIKGLLD